MLEKIALASLALTLLVGILLFRNWKNTLYINKKHVSMNRL